jgi:hypothetical protein
MELRRTVPQQHGWPGRCLIDHTPPLKWRDWLVIDITTRGVDINVFGIIASELVGRRAEVGPHLGRDIGQRSCGG